MRWAPASIGLLLLAAVAEGQQEPAEPTPAAPLEAQVSESEDRRLEQGLLERLEAFPGLEEPAVEVAAGVVVLRGRASSPEIAQGVEGVVRRVEGVAFVDNRIEIVEAAPIERLMPELSELRHKLRSALLYLPVLGLALVVLGVALLAARWLRHRRQPFERLFDNLFVRDIARQVAAGVVALVGILLALDVAGATAVVAAVLGTAGVVGLAVGFAFRDLVENYIASVLLSIRQPFAPRDYVRINDQEGRVLRLTTRATILMTLDGNHLRIPNAEVFKATILNFTRNPTRRFEIKVGVGVDVDLLEAQRLGVDVLQETPGVLDDPPPSAFIVELADSSVVVRYHAWVDQRSSDFAGVKGEAIRRVKKALEEAAIDMPEPIYRLRLESATPAAKPALVETVEVVPTPAARRDEPAAAPRASDGEEPGIEELRPRDELEKPIERDEAETTQNLLDETSPQE